MRKYKLMKQITIYIYQWLLIPCIIYFLCIPTLSQAQENLSLLVKKIKPSVVTIITYDEQGKVIGQGNGFFIGKDGDVITNYHILEDASSAEIKTAEGQVYNIMQI